MKTRHGSAFSAAALAALAIGSTANASNWGSFDASRINYPDGPLTGSAHTMLQDIITGNGDTIVEPTPLLTANYLDGVDVFYTSLLSQATGTLSPDEQTALQNWIAGGGTLIVTADIVVFEAYESFTSFYGVTNYTGFGNNQTGNVLAAHPITAGVTTYLYNTNSTYTYGEDALLLGDDGLRPPHDFMIVMEPGTGFDAGGRILVIGDHNMFTNTHIGDSENTQLATNIVQWASACGTETNLLLFREADDAAWGFGPEGIPGWDHVAILFDDGVYEAHPGYPTGDYVDPICDTTVHVEDTFGVQHVHSFHTFQHDATQQKSDAANIVAAIDADLASTMKTFIASQIGEPFFNPDCSDGGLLCMVENLNPEIQKHRQPVPGGELSYTCVGLIERAAEEAGHNDGDGFVRPVQESFEVGLGTVPMLSPQIMAFILEEGALDREPEPWMAGMLDPVDFILTDPLGRRLGHTTELGTINEIPESLFTGDGIVEQVAILNPVPGTYEIELIGLGEQAEAAFGGTVDGTFFQGFLDVGETAELTLFFPDPCTWDLDGDGLVGTGDLILLLGSWGDPYGTADLIELLGNWGPCPK